MRNIIQTTCVLAMLSITPSYAGDFLQKYVPEAKEVGHGRLRVMLWDVYDATLYATQGQMQKDKPFALKLSYLRSFEGDKIADRSIQEMRSQGIKDEIKLADWHTQMKKIFPDVDKGVSLTGVLRQDGVSIFFENSREIGRITDPAFGSAFFNIWLSEKTNAPDLRRKLLGAT